MSYLELESAKTAIDAVLDQATTSGEVLAELAELRDYVNEKYETLATQLEE